MAVAKDVSVTLTDKDQQVLRALFDLALKQGGMAALGAVTYLNAKIDVAGSNKVKTAPVTPEGAIVNDELLKKDDEKTDK